MFLDITFFCYYKLKCLRKNIKLTFKINFSISIGKKLGLGLHNFDPTGWNTFISYENQNKKKSNLIEWN